MVTFLASPKPFTGINAINQVNAIKSWDRSIKEFKVILCGTAEGLHDATRDLGVSIYWDVKCNEFGTPLFDDIYEKLKELGFLYYGNSHQVHIDTDCRRLQENSIFIKPKTAKHKP